MITEYENQYMAILKEIYKNGYTDGTNERTGLTTKRLPCVSIRVDVEKEFPILKSKQVFAKTAEREVLWIWQKMSNNIHDLKGKIWDEWADEKGSIGKAYGYQMAKPVVINEGHWDDPNYRVYSNQTAFVLDYLKEFPNGRHAKTTLWNVAELKDMNLVPCVHSTDWNLDGGRLNLVLQQRSGDMPYGVPFNTTQYAMLQCMFAREIGVKPGILLHCIADAHIYANQMDGVKKQIQRYNMMQCVENIPEDGMVKAFRNQLEYAREVISPDLKDVRELCALLLNVKNAHPEFVIDDNIRSFWDMNVDNAKMQGYLHLGKIDFGDIAV